MANLNINVNRLGGAGGGNALAPLETGLARIKREAQNITNIFIQQNVSIRNEATSLTLVTNNLGRVDRATQGVSRRTSEWVRLLERGRAEILRIAQSGAGLSRLGAQFKRDFTDSFSGIFGGGGISGLIGGAVRTPFAVTEFGLKLGGDIGKAVLGGLGSALGSVGSAVSPLIGGLGAVAGVPLAAAGGILKVVGDAVGAAASAAGEIVGAAGELGGRIAEGIVGGLSKGLLVAGGVTANSIRQAINAQGIERGFADFAPRTGLDTGALLNRLRSASRGQISDVSIQRNATLALSSGAAESAEDLEKLFRAADRLARFLRSGGGPEEAITRLTGAIVTQQRRLVDDLTIFPEAEEAFRRYADAIGVSADELSREEKILAFRNETFRQSEERIKALGEAQEGADVSLRQTLASITNVSTQYGRLFIPAVDAGLRKVNEFVGGLKDYLTANEQVLQSRITDFFESLPDRIESASVAVRGLAGGFADLLGVGNLFDRAEGFVGRLVGDPRAALSDAREAIGEFISNIRNRLSEETGSALDSALMSLRTNENVRSAFRELGTSLGDAAVEAVKSSLASLVTSAAGGIVGSIVPASLGIQRQAAFDASRAAQNPGAALGGAAISNLANQLNLLPFITAGSGSLGGPTTAIAGAAASVQASQIAEAITRALGTRATTINDERRQFLTFGASRRAVTEGFSLGAADTVSGDFRASRDLIRTIRELDAEFTALGRESVRENRDALSELRDELRDTTEAARTAVRAEERRQRTLDRLETERIRLASQFSAAVEAVSRSFEMARSNLIEQTRGRLGGLAGDIAGRFRGGLDLPGVSLNARAAFLRSDRQDRRSLVRDINSTFGSRGVQGFGQPSGIFGTVSGGAQLAGFGASAGSFGDLAVGLQPAADESANLLQQITESAAFAKERAAIIAESRAEAAKLQAETLAELKRLAMEQDAKDDAYARALEATRDALSAEATRASAAEARVAAIEKQIADIAANARRLAARFR